jgi:hypothetical protein
MILGQYRSDEGCEHSCDCRQLKTYLTYMGHLIFSCGTEQVTGTVIMGWDSALSQHD